MIQNSGNISLDWLAKESCLCAKQFKRKFNERVGINPKSYAKIIRFTKAFNTKKQQKKKVKKVNNVIKFGEDVEGYTIPVLNEREIRASAGVLFLVLFISLMSA